MCLLRMVLRGCLWQNAAEKSYSEAAGGPWEGPLAGLCLGGGVSFPLSSLGRG